MNNVETLEPILSAHPFFHDLDPHYLSIIVGCARNVRFSAGDFLFRSGEEATQFFLIRAGRVALEVSAPGRPPLIIETIGEGEILGFLVAHPALLHGVRCARGRADPCHRPRRHLPACQVRSGP